MWCLEKQGEGHKDTLPGLYDGGGADFDQLAGGGGVPLVLKGEFEQAERILNKLSYDNVSNEQLFLAHGLAVMPRCTQKPIWPWRLLA